MDCLNGGVGNETRYDLAGGAALTDGVGGDFLTGGKGADRFVFTSKLAGEADRIADSTEGICWYLMVACLRVSVLVATLTNHPALDAGDFWVA